MIIRALRLLNYEKDRGLLTGLLTHRKGDRTGNLLACGRSTFPEKSLISNE
ncbi:hypothetical protein NDI43_25455 [Microcoleus vaginatus GB2-A3]